MENITTYLNKNFYFLYQSPLIENKKKKRHLIGAGQLSKYVGKTNALSVQILAINMKTDKHIRKFRKCGIIEIYVK